MPHISKNKLSKKTEKELINSLDLVFTTIQNNNEMSSFLNVLLTDTERLMIAKRLGVIIFLEEGLNDSQIADILHVTRITVAKTRFYKEAHGEGFQLALKILKQRKEYEAFKKTLISLARYSIRAAGGYVKPTILD